MSKRKFILMQLGLLALLWAVLMGAFYLLQGQPTWTYMAATGVLVGLYGVGQKYLRDKYKK